MNEFSLISHRQLFPALANKSYFNYGGQGVLAEPTLTAILEAFEYVQRSGPFGLRVNAWTTQVAQQVRQQLAKLLNVDAKNISLTEDVTVGCNIALWGMPWQADDHILLTDCEHPGVIAAVQEIERRYGVTSTTAPLLMAANATALLVSHLTPQTKLVVISHVLWNTGQILPLAEIMQAAKAYNPEIRVLVDAAQSVGMMPLNLIELGVDFYAFTGHKWCCGPEGVGGLYVSSDARSILKPTFIGWRSLDFEAAAGGGFLPDGRQYEVATSAYPLYAGLSEALATQDRCAGILDRHRQVTELSAYLWTGLNKLPGVKCWLPEAPQTGLVSFQLAAGGHDRLVQKLETQGIFLRTLFFPDCIRACVHYLTTYTEIDALLAALTKISN
jgi:L-cysteine/cystine lyase